MVSPLDVDFTDGTVWVDLPRSNDRKEKGTLDPRSVSAYAPQPSVVYPSTRLPLPASPTVAPSVPVPGTVRSRVARDLHDGVGQSLSSLLVQIRVAMARGEASPDDLRSFEHGAQEALHTVRTFAYNVRLNPASEELESARRFAERILATSGSTFSWVDRRHNRRLGRKVASQVAWVIRESVTNVVHYARAACVEVRLEDSHGRIRVTVRDDGVGFSPENLKTTPEGRGLGLVGNAERMAEIGGIFTLRSSPGHGTVVLLEAPRYPRRSAAASARVKPSPLLPQGATEVAAAGI